MPLYEPYLPIRYVKPLLEMLAQQSANSFTKVLRQAELTKDKLRQDAAMLTFTEFDRLVCATSKALRCNDLGFRLGQRITIDSHDALSLVLRQCRTMDELLRTIVRFHKLITNGFFFIYKRNADYGELTFRPAAALGKESLHFMEELFATSFHKDICELLSNKSGLDIFLSIPKPSHAERYRQLPLTRFHFSANALPEVRCRLPAHLLDLPLAQPKKQGVNQAASLIIGDHLTERSTEYSKWVSLILREAEGVQPRLNQLAKMLSISPRTLNRKLLAEGTTLRELSKVVRFERAKYLLENSNEAINQIARRLGYSSTVSFYIAFRNSAKIGPREYRSATK